MEKNNTKETIYSFFRNKIPRNEQLHFQNWLLKNEDKTEKEEMMNCLWEETTLSADESTYQDLKEIHSRINYLDRKTKPLYISFARIAAIIVLPLLVFSATYIYFNSKMSEVEVVQYYVPKGETKHLVLSDGTEVWINSDSYLSLPKTFDSKTRKVNLTGEAYFQVSKDPKKPFIVRTNKMNIKVLGTKFNINAYPDIAEVKTTLKEGKVNVEITNEKKNDTYLLAPNEELSFNIKTGDITKREVDAASFPAWNSSNMIFNATLLNDLFKQLERRYSIRIANESHKYDNKRLTVKFENSENVDEIFHILQLMIPELKIKKQENIIIIK